MDKNKQAFDQAIATLTQEGQPFELVRRTIDDVDYTMYANAPQTLHALYLAAEPHGSRECLVYEGERLSFDQLFAQAWCLAAALEQKHGVSKGDRVGIAMRNYPEWLSAFVAITAMGAVAVPINSWGKARDLLFAVRDSGCKTVFCDQQRYQLMADGLTESKINAVVARADSEIESGHWSTLEAFIAGTRGATAPAAIIDDEDTAMIMYTSGTTGTPKGAVSTHRAICQAIMNFDCTAAASAMANPELIGNMMNKGFEPVQMLAVPLFHVSGLHAIFLTALRAGRKIVMLYKWNAEHALQLIEQERVTILSAAPSMLLQLLESPDFDRYDTSSLCSLGGGGSATPARVTSLMNDKVDGVYPGTGWGMTETNSIGTAFTGQAFIDNPRSAGFCHATVETKVCDENGNELPRGEAGRLWIKTPTVVNEYWNRPDANAESFRDGWFDTEDIGYFDENGYLYLSDRAKDMIIRGGENVYPAEIEAALAEHSAVQEVAAYGIPDETLGEVVAVSIVTKAGLELSEAEAKSFAQQQLAAFKVPAHMVIQAEPLPRNAAGKVLKNVLRDAWEGS